MMDNKVIIALVKAIVLDEIKKNPGLRGKRGLKGIPGSSFVFTDHVEEITNIINGYITSIKGELAPEISEEELESLRLKFSDLSEEERLELKGEKGARGQRGKPGLDGKDGVDGKCFVFDDHSFEIINIIESFITNNKEEFRGLKGQRGLKGKDGKDGQDGKSFDYEESKEDIEKIILDNQKELFENSKEELKGERGPRGQRGKPGQSFTYEAYSEEINNKLNDIFNENKENLKLAFSDLSEDEKDSLKLKFENLSIDEIESLRGQRGVRGQRGKQGLKGEKGETGKDGRDGIHGIDGIDGRPGRDGKTGIAGVDGKDAPRIERIEVEELSNNRYRLKFYFDNDEIILTNTFKLPVSKKLLNQTIQMIANGGGSGGGIQWSTPVDANILPDTDSTYTIGEEGNEFAEIHSDLGCFTDVKTDTIEAKTVDGSITIKSDIVPETDSDQKIGDVGNEFLEVHSDLVCATDLKVDSIDTKTDDDTITFNSNRLTDLLDPIDPQDAATKKYVDDNIVAGGCAIVAEDNQVVTSCLKKINFKGDLVSVSLETAIVDWATFSSVVPSMAGYQSADPDLVNVCIDTSEDPEQIAAFTTTKIASEQITALQLVSLDTSTTARRAKIDTYTEAVVAGIALQDANIGETFPLVTLGIYNNNAFNFAINEPLFLASDSTITTVAVDTTGKFRTKIGKSYGNGEILVAIEDPKEIL